MSNKKNQLPVFGIGPVYVLSCFCLAVIGLILHYRGYLNAGEIKQGKILFTVLSFCLFFFGIMLWAKAVILQKIDKAICDGRLVTNGVYGIVRNPIYSAFLFIFTGVMFFAGNCFLLILPFIFWAFLTLLIKRTEEKWLKEKFGKEYTDYCERVNRVIPWFPRKKN